MSDPAEFDCHGCGQHIVAFGRRWPLPVPLLCGGCDVLGVETHRAILAVLQGIELREGGRS